jgi:formyltetrahydrofolate deformylase
VVTTETRARLVIRCADQPGIVAAVGAFLFRHGANITELDQHSTDPSGGRFFMRLEFQTPSLDVSQAELGQFFAVDVARKFGMDWRIRYAAERPRMAVLVSAHDHAALELLWRWRRGELAVDIPLVISNHVALRNAVESFGVLF